MVARKVKGRNHRSADAVADHFLLKIDVSSGDTISNQKIQKLCYLAQGWSLAKLDRPLFDDAIEAWGFGPTIFPLFRRFSPYRWGALSAHTLRTDPTEKLDAEELELLDWVWDKYGRCSGSDLRVLVCERQTPWKEAHDDNAPPLGRCKEEITQASMRAYFLKQMPKPRSRRKVKISKPAQVQVAQEHAVAAPAPAAI